MRAPSLAIACVLFAGNAAAASRSRFEPTDLELENGGVVDLDLQVGSFRGDPSRPLVTDLEVDIGIARNVEIDIDAASYGESGGYGFVRRHSDPIWTSMKLGLIDGRDERLQHLWGLGVQLGPRFAASRTDRGIGYEALLLAERQFRGTRVALNSGVIIDPPTTMLMKHATGIELGIDVTTMIDERWSIIAELGVLRFLTNDPHQAYTTLGLSHALTPFVDVHALVLYGFVTPGDRLGFLLGVSPKFALFR